ncbi:MAG TPA: hypothetical protein VKS21_01700, partial [Spirochaetota bacterium]|nr:hypothetical protein [Spirochaetota bacterium]
TNFYCDNSLVNNWVAFPIEPDLIMDIATNGRPNYGLIIMNSSETGEGANRYLKFATREEGHTEYLEIVYTEIM